MTGTREYATEARYGLNLFGISLLTILGVMVWEGFGERLVIAAPLLLVAILISVLAPGAGVAGVLAATPTMYELHPMPRGEFSLLELAILVFVAGVSIRMGGSFVRRDWAPWRALVQPAQIVIPVILVLLATAVALLMVADPSRRNVSLREVRTVIVEPILFLGAARVVFRDSVHRTFSAAALVGVGTLVAAYAALQVMLDAGGVRAGDVLRATGTYPHPNNLSFFLERTFLVTVAVALARPRWWPVLVLAFVQFFALGLTWSRGAWLAAAFGIAVVLLVRRMYRWLVGLGIAGLVTVAAAFIVAPDRLIDAGGSGSEPTRFTIWRASLHMAKDHPIFGVGPDQFLYQYWRRYVEPRGWPERWTSHPHNLVLDVWLSLGVAGLAAFGTLLSGIAWWCRRTWTSVRADVWATGAVAALAAGLLHGMVDNGFFLPDLATLTWFFVLLIVTAPAVTPERDVDE